MPCLQMPVIVKKLAGIEMPYLSQFCLTGINQVFVCVWERLLDPTFCVLNLSCHQDLVPREQYWYMTVFPFFLTAFVPYIFCF